MDFTDTDTTVPSILPEDHKPPRHVDPPKKHPVLKLLLLGVLVVILFIIFKR
jgi:hypothetical protein